MTQDLANKLIAYYEESIREIEKMDYIHVIRKYLFERKIYLGVCYCSYSIFKTDLYDDEWVESKSLDVFDVFWFKYPNSVNTKDKILEALQYRVDILKTFKENG